MLRQNIFLINDEVFSDTILKSEHLIDLNKLQIAPAIFHRKISNKDIYVDALFKKIYKLSGIEEKNIEDYKCAQEYLVSKKILKSKLNILIDSFNNELPNFPSPTNVIYDDTFPIYANENGLSTVTIELTYKCNEKCVHCYIDQEQQQRELTKEE
jgi:hypothetical protein